MVMEPVVLPRPVQVRLERESLQPVQEQCWLRHMQHPILRRQACRMLEFHRPVRHMLVRMDHILASGSSTLAALASASSALAMKA